MIYVLEDDDNIRELVIYTLQQSGYEAKGFSYPSKLFQQMEKELCDLLLLDIMLPEMDGIEILKRLKVQEQTKHIPVIFLSAKGSEYDKVIGLDVGADDYITKPFGMMELISRVRALLRRTARKEDTAQNAQDDNIKIEGLEISFNKRSIKIDNNKVMLTKKEFEILELLIKNKSRIYTRDMLLQQIWGYDFDKENRTVDVHIRTLRVKLQDYGKYIRTIRGIGYQWSDENE